MNFVKKVLRKGTKAEVNENRLLIDIQSLIFTLKLRIIQKI